MGGARVTILSFSPIARDARVLRQVERLAAEHSVTVVAHGSLPGREGTSATMRPVPEPKAGPRRQWSTLFHLLRGRLGRARSYDDWYWSRAEHRAALAEVVASRPEVIHANDWDALPVAVRAAAETRARIVLDLHEYAPRHFENRQLWAALIAPGVDYHLRAGLPFISASSTVNQSLADEYARQYGTQPIVVLNAPAWRGPAPAARPTDPDCIRLVHHGIASPDRQLEGMIDAVGAADERYRLHFMLVGGSPRTLARLRRRADRTAPGRVAFEETVEPHAIVTAIARFDMGLFLLPPVNFNYRYALPNKFFDFVNAALAVCTGPSVEMARLSAEHGFGVASSDFAPASIAALLRGLGPADIDRMKQAAARARPLFHADREMEKVCEIYRALLS